MTYQDEHLLEIQGTEKDLYRRPTMTTVPDPTNEASTALGISQTHDGWAISRDQVAWLLDIAERYLPPSAYPPISREREMRKYAMLYEIMEIANLRFQDDSARWNGTPNDVRNYGAENQP